MVGSQALGRGKYASFSPEELKNILDELDKYYPVANKQAKPSRLKAENERLRKAGDAMATMVGHIEVTGDAHRMMLELSKEWQAAKEGKPSV